MVIEAILPENTFLVEIRLARTKWRIKRITERITTHFSIPECAERHPHVTLFGPFSLRKGITFPELRHAVDRAAAPYSAAPFLINGYDKNQGLNGAVLAYRVIPSDVLISLNQAISSAIRPLADTVNVWDTDTSRKWFHITIANRLDREQGSRIFDQLAERETGTECPGRSDDTGEKDTPLLPRPPVIDEDGIRISMIHGEEILAEYDLIRHRWFRPKAPSAATEWARSLRRFRRERGIELKRRQKHTEGGIYAISDLHLGHTNIIRYCSRPFTHDAVDEMDKVLIRNWNYTVSARDTVFHLGDLAYRSDRPATEYIRLLNGIITRIAGNHDRNDGDGLQRQVSLVWGGIPFTLVHDPADAVPVSGGWVIHGHHHNNDLSRYPFISFRDHRINVSAEVVGYRPVSLAELASVIRKHSAAPDQDAILLRDQS